LKQIKYGDDAFVMRFEMPASWDVESITEVTIGIDRNATSLLDATAATLYTATTLNGAVVRTAGTVTIANDATAVVEGDRLRIAESASGPAEDVEVHSYNSSTKVVTIKRELNDAHANGAAVYGMWASYDLDASDTDVFVKGYVVEVTWTPDSDNQAYTERYVIGSSGYATTSLWRTVSKMWKSLWNEYSGYSQDDLNDVEEIIRSRFDSIFKNAGLDANRIVDKSQIDPGFALYGRMVLLEDGGDEKIREYEVAKTAFYLWFDELKKSPIWSDDDQDESQDETEIRTHTPYFLNRIA
jgi:hypothetical protein